MGLIARSSSVVSPARAMDPFAKRGMYSGYYPLEWGVGLSAAGIHVTPELAMCLSAMWSGITRIGGDFMRMPAHVLRVRDDGGKDRVRGGPDSGAIGSLAYRLRWKPNVVQTAAAFFACLAAQFKMRARAYAEIIPDATGPFGQLVPRHPDRVIEERLPSGRLRFKVLEPMNAPQPYRYVTQDEMLYVHDTSGGSFASLGMVQYGTQAIGTALAAEHAAAKFFHSGMTAAVLATHPGELEEEEKKALHGDITRFAAGKDNNFGLLLVQEDIKVSALGIDPQKAQMMEARNFGVREIARLLKMPPELLYADNTGVQTGRSLEEIVILYHTGCLGPIVSAFEQAMQDALILMKDTYIIEFLMDALYRGDLKSRADYYAKAIEAPWIWPSEVRVKEGLNPDPELDAIAEKRYRPADPKGSVPREREGRDQARSIRASHRLHLLVHDNALRVLRRERAAVEKLAKKYASDVDGWRAGLRDFFADHARFVAETMRMDIQTARAYCAQHGTELEANGIAVYDEHWERRQAEELAAWSLEGLSEAA